MRLMARLSVAFLTALAIVALIGVGEAPALELCSVEEEEPCSEENVHEEGTVIEAESAEAAFESNLGTVICESLAEGQTSAEVGSPLPAYFTELSFSACMLGETSCKVSAINLGYYAFLEDTKETQASLTLADGGEGNPAVQIECGEALSCTLGGEEIVLDVKGGSPSSIHAEKESLEQEGGSECPAEAAWTVVYTIATPTQIHPLPTTTTLCSANPMRGPCPMGFAYAGGVEGNLNPTTTKFVSTGGPTGTISCEEAPLVAESFAQGGTGGKIKSLLFDSGGACTSTLMNSPAVKVTLPNLPFNGVSFVYRSTVLARLIVAPPRAPVLKFVINLGTPQSCRYRPSLSSWVTTGHTPLKLKTMWHWVELKENGNACPTLMKTEGEWFILRAGGGNLWIAP